jgi:lysophospholipase L1-like esterase
VHPVNVPHLRVATFFTAEGRNMTYALTQRSMYIKRGVKAPGCFTYTVQLLIEPSFIMDTTKNNALTIEGLSTDGVLVSTPAPPKSRSIEILGDSLTAGYGAGFDLPHSQSSTCSGGGLTDDQAMTYGALLCSNFSAQCSTVAVSGITLYTANPNLPLIWDLELGAMQHEWPALDRVPYNASRFQPDTVLINLGENDWGGGKCGTTPDCPIKFQAAYVAFVRHISSVYAAVGKRNITFFLTIGPHEHSQSSAIIPAVAQLKASGVNAVFLNATVPDFGTIGCGGHPGITIHRASFERAQPVIAAAMGWD